MNVKGLLAAVLLCASGCGPSSATYEVPQNLPGTVLSVAEQYLEARGPEIGQYELDGLTFDYLNRRWFVSFHAKSLAIGDHFSLLVSDDDLNSVEFVPGI